MDAGRSGAELRRTCAGGTGCLVEQLLRRDLVRVLVLVLHGALARALAARRVLPVVGQRAGRAVTACAPMQCGAAPALPTNPRAAPLRPARRSCDPRELGPRGGSGSGHGRRSGARGARRSRRQRRLPPRRRSAVADTPIRQDSRRLRPGAAAGGELRREQRRAVRGHRESVAWQIARRAARKRERRQRSPLHEGAARSVAPRMRRHHSSGLRGICARSAARASGLWPANCSPRGGPMPRGESDRSWAEPASSGEIGGAQLRRGGQQMIEGGAWAARLVQDLSEWTWHAESSPERRTHSPVLAKLKRTGPPTIMARCAQCRVARTDSIPSEACLSIRAFGRDLPKLEQRPQRMSQSPDFVRLREKIESEVRRSMAPSTHRCARPCSRATECKTCAPRRCYQKARTPRARHHPLVRATNAAPRVRPPSIVRPPWQARRRQGRARARRRA